MRDECADLKLVAKAKRDYVSGYGSVASIAAKYGLNAHNLQCRASVNNWRAERDASLGVVPMNGLQGALAVWRAGATELLDKLHAKVESLVERVDSPKDAGMLVSAATSIIDCQREVFGIPRLAALKMPEKQEKTIQAEVEPL